MLGGVDAVSPNDIWSAGSYYDEEKGIWETLTVHWNGVAWSIVPSLNPGTYTNALGGVAALSANDAWAVGAYSSGDGVRTLAEHWDGVHWRIVPTPNVATGYGTTNTFGSVVALGPNDVWAAGMYQNQDTDLHQHRPLLAHWDGTSWTLVPVPSPGKSSSLSDIAFGPNGEAFGVGIFSEYPIDIYDGHYTLAQALTLGAGTETVGLDPGTDPSLLGLPTPNPSTGRVSFTLHVPQGGEVALSLFDLRGRRVRSILSAPGDRSVAWDGLDEGGGRCRSGIYFARLSVDGRIVASRSVALTSGDHQ